MNTQIEALQTRRAIGLHRAAQAEATAAKLAQDETNLLAAIRAGKTGKAALLETVLHESARTAAELEAARSEQKITVHLLKNVEPLARVRSWSRC